MQHYNLHHLLDLHAQTTSQKALHEHECGHGQVFQLIVDDSVIILCCVCMLFFSCAHGAVYMVALHLMVEMMRHIVHVDCDGLLLQVLDTLDSDLSVLGFINAI